jgi:TM2 domain-containing membrane protein YozV
MTDTPASWQPDPTGRHQYRYWDGSNWTENVSDDGVVATDSIQLPPPGVPAPPYAGEQLKSKVAAGVLGILLGGFGVHRFYLGFVGIGILQIVVTILTLGIGALWGFIEGILILTGSMNRDAKGRPLRD